MDLIPSSVRKGVYALALATVVTVLYIWSDTDAWEAAARMPPLMLVMFVGVNGFFIACLVLTWRRQNWARWIAIIWSALAVLAVLTSWVFFGAHVDAERIAQTLVVALQIWGCYQLLTKSASLWFRQSASV